MNRRPIALEIPGGKSRFFANLILDFTGTLSLDGVLLPGVAERIRSAAEHLDVTVLTADTFGTAEAQLAGLPVEMRRRRTVARGGCRRSRYT
jgi:soluble P-type ATPase